MFNISKHNLIKIFTHLLVWSLMIFVLFMYPPLISKRAKLPADFVIKQTAHILLMLSAYYVNAYYLIPRLLFKNKILAFAVAIALFAFFSSFALAMVDGWLDITQQMAKIFGKKMWANPYIDFFGLLTTLFVLGISSSIAIVNKWTDDTKARQNFENQKITTELSFLKAQIHPHFFFNTLNSIYALTYTNVETSRRVLYKLSRMMRYLLYETDQDETPLTKELGFIEDYVGIMKLRVNTNTEIEFTYPEIDKEMNIAPMLILPYVENAFKYGIDDVEKSIIAIEIKQLEDGIILNVRNKIMGQIGGLYEKNGGSGIGQVNTKRRLDLLYKDKYKLDAHADQLTNEYHLNLQITLK